MKLQFFGAAGIVTGSRTLVTSAGCRILVDCGMFQGRKADRLRNWDALDVGVLDAVVLTHAHIDHSGWIPALIARGYRGPVYCTPATAELLAILWPDAGRIQEDDAKFANRHGSSKHTPALPLFTEADAVAALDWVRPVPFDTPFTVGDLTLGYRTAGHILGAASLWVRSPTRSVLFSGDLGRPNDLVMPAPAAPPAVDVVVLESTYGQRLHPESDLLSSLAGVIQRTIDRGGMVLIPSFAVGRAQTLLWALHTLMESGRLPRIPIVVDSPMARRATRALVGNPGGLRLDPADLEAMCAQVRFVRDVEESKSLNDVSTPFILIAASGMLTGGRVLHHLALRAPVKRNTLLFVGFQAAGTRGARLVAGESPVTVFGNKVKVRCEVTAIAGLSAHADADELVAWLAAAPDRPQRVFLNHGEPEASEALRVRLQASGYDVVVATEGLAWDLDDLTPLPVVRPVDRLPLEQLLTHLTGLRFKDPADLPLVRAAVDAMAHGTVPRVPIHIVGDALATRIRTEFPTNHPLFFE